MRKTSVVIGIIAVFALTGPSVAGSVSKRVEFHFARPATAWDTFRQDQTICNRSAIVAEFRRQDGSMASAYVRYSHSAPAFLRCMTDKGYRLDPNGYSTGRMQLAI